MDKLRLIFFTLFFLVTVHNVFPASSSSSSNLSSDSIESQISKDREIDLAAQVKLRLTGFQLMTYEYLKKLKEMDKFPAELLALITSLTPAEDYLLNALYDSSSGRKKIEKIKKALQEGAIVNNSKDSNEYFGSPLHHVIGSHGVDDFEINKLLLDSKANVNAKTSSNDGSVTTPLTHVIFRLNYFTPEYNAEKTTKVIELLLQRNANPNVYSDTVTKKTPLISAVNYPRIAKLLLEHGADPQMGRDEQGRTYKEIIRSFSE